MAWRAAHAHAGWWLPACTWQSILILSSLCHNCQGLWQVKRKWKWQRLGECSANCDEMIAAANSIGFREKPDLKTMVACKWESHDTDPFQLDVYLNWRCVFVFVTYMVGMLVLRGFNSPHFLQRSSLSQAAWFLIRGKFCWHGRYQNIKCGFRCGLLCFFAIVYFLELEGALNVTKGLNCDTTTQVKIKMESNQRKSKSKTTYID